MVRVCCFTMVHIHILGGMDMKILSANDTSVGLTDQIAPGRKQGPPRLLGSVCCVGLLRALLLGPKPYLECGFSPQLPPVSIGTCVCLDLCSRLRETLWTGPHRSVQTLCSAHMHSSFWPLAPVPEYGLGNSHSLFLNSVDLSGSFWVCWS